MLTRCYQFSVVDDTNLIGIHNGGQFVSNHHEGLAFYKFCNKQLTEQKDQLQRQYTEAKRQMQEYDIIKQNVDGILRITPGKEQMQER